MDHDSLVELVKRAPVLQALGDSPASTTELEQRLCRSRSTIHRATTFLGERGFVRNQDGAFALTPAGEAVAEWLAETETHVETLDRLAPILNAAPAVSFPVGSLADATVLQPQGEHVHFVVKRVTDLIRDAETLRLFTPVVSPVYVDICCRQVQAGTAVRAVFDRDVVDLLFEEYAETVRPAVREGTFEVLIDDDCPFELFLVDDRVGFTAHTGADEQLPFVESSDPTVYDWAEALFEECVEAGEHAHIF